MLSAQPSGEDRLAVSELIGLVGIGANTGVCTDARDGAMASVEVLGSAHGHHQETRSQSPARP